MTPPIPALVLTAGLGTRLFPLTLTRAKPAAPVAGVSLVERILRGLSDQGIHDVVLNLHHRPDTITAVVGDGSHLNLRARYCWEQPRVLGSAGGPRHALPLLASETFFLVNGDTMTDASLAGLLDDHRQHGAAVTMAVISNDEPDRYSGALVDDSGAITGFAPRGDIRRSWHVIGLQAVEARAFESLADDVPAETTRGLYLDMIRRRHGSVRAWRTEASFVDIGTPRDYLQACLATVAREAGSRLHGQRATIARTAHVSNSVLWDDVRVEAGGEVHGCVLADGSIVPAGLRLANCAAAPSRLLDGPLPDGARIKGELVVVPISM